VLNVTLYLYIYFLVYTEYVSGATRENKKLNLE